MTVRLVLMPSSFSVSRFSLGEGGVTKGEDVGMNSL